MNALAQARAAGVVTGGNHLLTQPTGSGKTALALEAAAHDLSAGRRVIVLVPFKSLADEVASHWGEVLTGRAVESYTRDTLRPRSYRHAEVLVMTPERLDLITRSWRRHHDWLARVGLIVADEIHTLTDPQRGASLDAALTRVRLINPLARLLALTATCGNPEDLAAWLEARHLHSVVRPVPLLWESLTVPSARDKRAALAQHLTDDPTLVFVQSRARAEELAAFFHAPTRPAGAHHAGLGAERRAEVLADFLAGRLSTLFCTPTLGGGVNTPCRRVVLYDLSVPTPQGFRPLSIIEAWQRAGRAGRDPRDEIAHVLVLGTAQEAPWRYTRPDFEPLNSPLSQPLHAQNFILGSVDGGLARTAAQVERLLGRTYAAQGERLDARWLTGQVLAGGGLEEVDGTLRVTPLGRVASQHMLSVASVKAVTYLPTDPTAFDVLLQACQHLETHLRPQQSQMPLLTAVAEQVPSRTLDSSEACMVPPQVMLSAAVGHSACCNGDAETAAAYSLYETQVRSLREEAGRIVQAWHALMPDHLKLRLTGVMLRSGTDLSGATLALLPGIGAVTARAWARQGIEDLETLAQSAPADLVLGGRLSEARAAALIAQAEQLVRSLDLDVTREPAPDPVTRWTLLGEQTDPVRLQRAMSLTVQEEGEGYVVTGGAAAHRVTSDERCDCPDHTRTRQCKHVLAVRLYRRDPATVEDAERLRG